MSFTLHVFHYLCAFVTFCQQIIFVYSYKNYLCTLTRRLTGLTSNVTSPEYFKPHNFDYHKNPKPEQTVSADPDETAIDFHLLDIQQYVKTVKVKFYNNT